MAKFDIKTSRYGGGTSGNVERDNEDGLNIAYGLLAIATSISEVADAIKTLKPPTPPTSSSYDLGRRIGESFQDTEQFR